MVLTLFFFLGIHECDSPTGFCDDKCPYTNGSYPFWRLRNSAEVQIVWTVSSIQMFSSSNSNKNLVENPTKAYASSYFGPGMSLILLLFFLLFVVVCLLLLLSLLLLLLLLLLFVCCCCLLLLFVCLFVYCYCCLFVVVVVCCCCCCVVAVVVVCCCCCCFLNHVLPISIE